MKTRLRALLTFGLCLNIFIISTAQAELNPRAVQFYNKGDYRAVVAIANTQNDADNYAFAARALITETSINRPSLANDKTLNEAQSLVNKALKINKTHKEALLIDAIITLIRARKAGKIKGFATGLPQLGKLKLDNLISLYPNYGEAWALRAAWHIEAVSTGGNSSVILGASAEGGINEYRKAITLDSDNVMIKYAFATSLILLDRNLYATAYSKLLGICASAKPTSKSDQIFIARARELKAFIDKGANDEAYKKVKSWL
jgi:hypothetical protein